MAHVSDYYKEEVTSIIDLKEDGPTAIWCMVQWFYSCDYTLDPTNSISFTNPTDDSLDLVNPLIVHLNVYIIADKYDLGLLKELAKLRFSGVLRAQIAGSIEWIQKDFPNIIRKVYDTTMASSDGLRERLMPMISEQWDLLRKEDAFMDLVRSVGDLTVDILDGWANDRCSLVNASVAGAPVVTYNCPSCRSNKAFDVSANGVNGICRTCRSRHRVAGWKKSEGWVY